MLLSTRHPLTRLYIFANSLLLCFHCRCRATNKTRCVITNEHCIPSLCLKHSLSLLLMGHLHGEGVAMHEALQAANPTGTPYPGPSAVSRLCLLYSGRSSVSTKSQNQIKMQEREQYVGNNIIVGHVSPVSICLCCCPAITHKAPRCPIPPLSQTLPALHNTGHPSGPSSHTISPPYSFTPLLHHRCPPTLYFLQHS